MPCLAFIFTHLGNEVINIFKVCFIAQFPDKFQFQPSTVQVTVKIE